jgi:hypothetical protein
MFANMSESDVTGYVDILFTFFSSQLVTSQFSLILIVFCQYFTWIVAGDIDLRFSLILVTKANAGDQGTIWAT